MNGKNLKYFVMGAAIVAAGLGAFAITLPAAFAPGEPLSAAKFNDYFTRIKNAIDALEAPASVTTVKIADGAVTAAKTADEPGFNTVQGAVSGNDSPVSVPSTRRAIRSVTLEAPEAGFAVVTADFNWNGSHATGLDSTAEFTLSKVEDAGSSTGAEDIRRVFIPDQWPSATDLSQPVSMSKVFTVTKGTNTFHLNALRASGNAGSQSVRGLRMIAVYLPSRYGTGATLE